MAPREQIEVMDRQIGHPVYDSYGLWDEAIKIIEEAIAL